MKMINFRELLLMLIPTFLRSGVLRALCNSIATTLQYCCVDVYDYMLLTRDTIKWTSERKAMRERLNLLFLGKSYDDSLANECILVEDGYDVIYHIIWNNEELGDGAWDKALVMTSSQVFATSVIIYNIEDNGIGCDLRVVVPDSKVGEINTSRLINETNRLVFAGLLCKFYSRKIIGNNNIDTEI